MAKPNSIGPNDLVSNSASGNNFTTYTVKGCISNENIVTTRDRAALVFHEYVRHREWTTDWLAYAAVFIGLLVTLLTSDFKGLIIHGEEYVSGGVCKGGVIIVCFGFLVCSVVCAARRFWLREKLTCKYFLQQLCKVTVNVD